MIGKNKMNYPSDFINKVICGDCLEVMKEIPNKSTDLIIIDPPYKQDFTNYFELFRSKLRDNGQMLWFVQPTEMYQLPKPFQILIWKEPYSPKPIRRKYKEFLDVICWYPYGNYTFNKLLWNLMNSVFEDVIIRDKRLHPHEKPEPLIEKLILIHTNPNDLVLDPFLGSGTTAIICEKLNRKFIGIEINPEYCKIAEERLRQEVFKL